MTKAAWVFPILLMGLAACGQTTSPLRLAAMSEGRVRVEVSLEWDGEGNAWLAATYTPEEGYHLYSKDLPQDGVEGLGRPTLLELPPGSKMLPAGALDESVPAAPLEDNPELAVYPAGAVTLRLPVSLPEGNGWYDEQVRVTYMACREGTCVAPVIGRLLDVRVPGSEELRP
jgi:hypothetical protein